MSYRKLVDKDEYDSNPGDVKDNNLDPRDTAPRRSGTTPAGVGPDYGTATSSGRPGGHGSEGAK